MPPELRRDVMSLWAFSMAPMNVLVSISDSSSPTVSKILSDIIGLERVKECFVACSVQPSRLEDVSATLLSAIKLTTELFPAPVSPKRITFLPLMWTGREADERDGGE